MQVIIPKVITEDILTSNIAFPAAGEVEWTAGSYNTGDQRYVGTTIYEALTTTTDEPTVGELAKPATWLNIGGVERYRMFDSENSTVTTGDISIDDGDINVTIEYSGLKDALALLNTDANSVTVTAPSVRGGSTYNRTIEGIDRTEISGWWSFYKAQRGRKSTFLFDDLPVFSDTMVTVSIENGANVATCGNMVIGQLYDLGETLSGMSPRIKNLSRYVTDTFGRKTYISKGSARELDVTVKYDTSKHDAIQRVMESIVGTPAVWIGTNKFTTSVVWGEGEYTPEVSNHTKSDANYVIEATI